MKKKKYTCVNYTLLYRHLRAFQTYGEELTVNEPDANSHVWQVADDMIYILQQIKMRAIRLERDFDKRDR